MDSAKEILSSMVQSIMSGNHEAATQQFSDYSNVKTSELMDVSFNHKQTEDGAE